LKRFAVAHVQNPRASFETVLLPLSPLGSPFHRPSLNLAGANPRRRFSLLLLLTLSLFLSLSRLSSGCPEYLLSADLYKVFTIFRALPLEICLSPLLSLFLSLSLFLAHFVSLATRDDARDPGDNPVYLSDKRPINLFALSPTPLPSNPRPPRAH